HRPCASPPSRPGPGATRRDRPPPPRPPPRPTLPDGCRWAPRPLPSARRGLGAGRTFRPARLRMLPPRSPRLRLRLVRLRRPRDRSADRRR
ncbi:MAG: hypothetical protein F4017_09755, partial [Acidimicrobiaceae bacterium]|nr:hypothetical protein [Acidimicrobiaceae bacterium]